MSAWTYSTDGTREEIITTLDTADPALNHPDAACDYSYPVAADAAESLVDSMSERLDPPNDQARYMVELTGDETDGVISISAKATRLPTL